MIPPKDQSEAFEQQRRAGMLPGQNTQALQLSMSERAELEACRQKARLESDAYYQQMRGMMNHTPLMTIAEMQTAQNVNLHARECWPESKKTDSNRKSIAESEAFKKIGEPEDSGPVFMLSQNYNPASQPPTVVRPLLKLILRQATYFLLLMLAIGVGLAVFL